MSLVGCHYLLSSQLLITSNCVPVFRWLPFVINLFANAENFKPAIRPEKLNSFYNSVSTLISNQVCLFCYIARMANIIFDIPKMWKNWLSDIFIGVIVTTK